MKSSEQASPPVAASDIWILEDDAGDAFVYEVALSGLYRLRMFRDLAQFEEAAQGDILPRLILADIRLPHEKSSLDFLGTPSAKRIENVPVIVVSGSDEIEKIRASFRAGAVDYISKPFGKNALLVKVDRAMQRETCGSLGLVCDFSSLKISRMGSSRFTQLTARELQIFSLLNRAPSLSVSRQELVSTVWGSVRVSAKTLDVHLCNLRRKLEDLDLDIEYHRPIYQVVSRTGRSRLHPS